MDVTAKDLQAQDISNAHSCLPLNLKSHALIKQKTLHITHLTNRKKTTCGTLFCKLLYILFYGFTMTEIKGGGGKAQTLSYDYVWFWLEVS